MTRPGTKPKPTYLRIISGNPGKRPLNKSEPKPVGDLSSPPGWFDADQKESWRYAIKHAPSGLLKFIDRSALAIWIVAECLHRKAATELAKSTILVRAPQTGLPIQNPYLPVINRQALIMLKAAAELGFTPSSRSRVSIGGAGGAGAGNPFLDHGEGA